MYRIIQSFKPGEVTPEETNRLGYELAMKFTGGQHQFVVATHTDKNHIHGGPGGPVHALPGPHRL